LRKTIIEISFISQPFNNLIHSVKDNKRQIETVAKSTSSIFERIK